MRSILRPKKSLSLQIDLFCNEAEAIGRARELHSIALESREIERTNGDGINHDAITRLALILLTVMHVFVRSTKRTSFCRPLFLVVFYRPYSS